MLDIGRIKQMIKAYEEMRNGHPSHSLEYEALDCRIKELHEKLKSVKPAQTS